MANPTSQRKLWHIEMIIDHSILHEMMLLAEGKAIANSLKVHPVKHAGADENGKLQEIPTGREFMLAFLATRSDFTMREAAEAAYAVGVSKFSVYNSVSLAKKDGLIKPGKTPATYIVLARAKKVKQIAHPSRAKKSHAGVSQPQALVEVIRKMQNGSGDGVPLKALRAAMGGKNISPAITDLLEQKLVVRTAPAMYRLAS